MEEIKKLLPHREPFLFVDGIVEIDEGKKCIGFKDVKDDEFWVKAHFPGFPIMPGVLIVEALAQVSLIIFKDVLKENLPIFVKIENITFKKPVFPKDRIILESNVLLNKMNFIKFKVSAKVNGVVVCEGNIIATLKRKEELLK